MTKIEELRIAANKAAQELDDAKRAVILADRALQDAVNEGSGLMGHVLQYSIIRGWGSKEYTIEKRILVDKIGSGWRGEEAMGRYIIASGEVGVMRGSVAIEKAIDLGVYEPKTK